MSILRYHKEANSINQKEKEDNMPNAVTRATNNYYFEESQWQKEYDRVKDEIEADLDYYVDRFKDVLIDELGKSETAEEVLKRLVITIEID